MVIDRKTTAPRSLAKTKFDVVFDTPALGASKYLPMVGSKGTYVVTVPDSKFLFGKLWTLLSSKRVEFVKVASKREDLELVGRWLSQGMSVTVDSSFKVKDMREAMDR